MSSLTKNFLDILGVNIKILVTGENGQVGSEIIQQGKQGGMQMIAAGRAELDITQIDNIKIIVHSEQPDMIINAAAYTPVDKAEEQIEKRQACAINRDGSTKFSQKQKFPYYMVPSTMCLMDRKKEHTPKRMHLTHRASTVKENS